ncbi:MAG: DUF929 family protein [Acidimicrobiales bacterium]
MDNQFSGTKRTSSRPNKSRRIALRWLGALSVAVVAAVGFPSANATSSPSGTPQSSPPPAVALAQAQSQLSALIATADDRGQALLDDAVSQLGAATPLNGTGASVSSLWADYQDLNLPVPPPYGETVFTSTEAAASDLVSLMSDPTVSRSALQDVGDAILQADQTIANDVMRQGSNQPSWNGSQFGPRAPAQIAADESQWEHSYKDLGNEITQVVTSVPQSTIDQAAEYLLESPIAAPTAAPSQGTGPELTANGKPEFFYFGAEGCPYCGIERWSMIVALSQFGQFSPLALDVSSTIDVYPGTSTLTFDGSTYSSPYLSFVPVEGFTNQPPSATDTGPGGDCSYSPGKGPWGTLQDLSSDQQALIAQYDPSCSFPFLDVANKWITPFSAYSDPQAIQGMSWQSIADALANPASEVAQSIDGAAVILTGEICEVTGEQPSTVCDANAVQQWQTSFP